MAQSVSISISITVRGREPEDATAIAAIMDCPGVVRGTLQLPYRPVQFIRERVAQSDPWTYQLVAEADGAVVGQLGLHLEQNPRRRHVASFGMAVHDAHQGQGVGSALMAAMVELAEQWLGLRRIELTVFTDNAPAIALYKKFGFEIEGTLREYALRDGACQDAYTMARRRSTMV